MALIPDEAIDRMYGELSSGARDLYILLCRCRNQTSGKCCPSVSTTQDALKLSRARVFALRKELATKGWAQFDGNNAIQLFGFASLKNKTIHELTKEDSGAADESLENKTASLENETAEIEESQKQDSPSLENKTDNVKTAEVIEFPAISLENETDSDETAESLKNKTESLKNKTEKSQKQDSHIRKNQQRNQQREPAKKDMSGPLTGKVREVFAYWQYRLDHRQSKLTLEREKKIQARLKEEYTVEDIKQAIDGCASSPWHMGQNDRDTVYDDIELICRDGKHLEGFMAKANGHSNGLSRFTPNAQKTVIALQSFVERNMAKEDL